MSLFLVGAGVWLFSDSLYSWALYAHSQSWRGTRQDFWHDNWVRLVRGVLSVGIVIVGVML